MRKNKMMRAASGLLVATLLTTSIISGTFAKYVTEASGSDEARVAKWGIQMDRGADMFSDTYDSENSKTVVGKDSAKVVAPGTKGSTTYKVTGAPETAYEITFTGIADNDVFLKSGLKYTYTDTATNGAKAVTYTKPAGATAETVNDDYYPVNYSIKIVSTGTFSQADTSKKSYIEKTDVAQTFETLADAMAALSNTKVTYAPNVDANLTVTISWNWQFEENSKDTIIVNNGHTPNDAYDTVLGDIAAKNTDLSIGTDNLTAVSDTTSATSENYDTTIKYQLKMTATQID